MVAAAGYADAFFHGEWFWGILLGSAAVKMCFYVIDLSREDMSSHVIGYLGTFVALSLITFYLAKAKELWINNLNFS